MSESGRGVLVNRDDFRDDFVGGGRKGGYVEGQYDELRLSHQASSDLILVRGKYRNRYFSDKAAQVVETTDAFHRYVRHPIPPQYQNPVFAKSNQGFDGKPRWTSLPCSSGPTGDSPCRPCSIPSAQVKGRPRFVYTAIHLAPYHTTPSKKDAERTYPKLCLEPFDKDCPGCKADYPIVPAARKWISLSNLDWEILGQTNLELKKGCACGGRLRTAKLVCGSCGDDLIVRSAQNKEEFRRARREGTFYCHRCGIRTAVAEWKTCDQCGNPRVRDVFNSILSLKLVKKENYTQMMITGTRPAGDLIESLHHLAVPLDLAAVFSPRSLREQADVLITRRTEQEPMSEER